nr:MAG TPA: core-binding factor subunit beta [Caudoviricetes sp.]DAU76642.1 MAG TPA: core-binding factor subunit beta [Caudoviricetes sp.]
MNIVCLLWKGWILNPSYFSESNFKIKKSNDFFTVFSFFYE